MYVYRNISSLFQFGGIFNVSPRSTHSFIKILHFFWFILHESIMSYVQLTTQKLSISTCTAEWVGTNCWGSATNPGVDWFYVCPLITIPVHFLPSFFFYHWFNLIFMFPKFSFFFINTDMHEYTIYVVYYMYFYLTCDLDRVVFPLLCRMSVKWKHLACLLILLYYCLM